MLQSSPGIRSVVPAAIRLLCGVLLGGAAWIGLGLPVSAGSLTLVNPAGVSPGAAFTVTGTGFNTKAGKNEVTLTAENGVSVTLKPSKISTVNKAAGLRRLRLGHAPAGV